MTNEEPEPVNYIVPPHPPRPAYRPTPATPATTSTPPTPPRASHAQPTTSSIPLAPIPRPSTYEFSDTESDHETPITPIQSRPASPIQSRPASPIQSRPASPAPEASSSEPRSMTEAQQIGDDGPRHSGRYRKPTDKIVQNLAQAQARAQAKVANLPLNIFLPTHLLMNLPPSTKRYVLLTHHNG